ncbi:hypothetical protein Taro_050640 [Colocasia esculenta]|uniref:Uncharacterized protein n=1 Tax=Colocasia esculenta TaxID=4460 RepID=A0A843XDY6_COLES|nr:hypothetical protein [Colocasia esculenta]
MSARRAKWHLPPPPTPRILHLPRRSRRRSGTAASAIAVRRPPPPAPAPAEHVGNPCGILEELFDRDRSFNRDRRARVDSRSPSPTSRAPRAERGSRPDSEEARWRLEAEVLRAECNFLRMEREVALRKLESNRVQMEAALRSAVQTLGRKKIDGEQGMGAALQEEIDELQSKLELLHRCSRRQRSGRICTSLDLTLRGQSSGSNFDRKASRLRRRLEEMAAKVKKTATSIQCEEEKQEEEEEIFVREIREIASESASVSAEKGDRQVDVEDVETKTRGCLMPGWRCRLHDVEILWMKMEGVSKVMLQRMESYESTLSSSSSSSSCRAARAAAANSKTDDPRVARTRQACHLSPSLIVLSLTYQNGLCVLQPIDCYGFKDSCGASADCVEDGKGFCYGGCREVVGKVMEQVREEAQQWNEMQSMLEQVRREMEDLQCARDFWERCAVASDAKLRAATAQVHTLLQLSLYLRVICTHVALRQLLEWRQKAQASEQRVSELQTQVRELQVDVETLRRELSRNLLPSSSTPPATPSPSGPRPQHCSSNIDPLRRIKCHPALLLRPQQQPQQQQQQRPLQQLLHKEKERRVQLCRSKENRHPLSQAPRSCQPRRPPLQEIGNASAFPCRT